METLFNNLVMLLMIMLPTTMLLGQQVLDTVDVHNIRIEGIGYNTPLDSVKKKLGKPLKYSTYEEEEGEAEGYDQWFYFTYDSLQLAFYEWEQKTYLFSFDSFDQKYKIELSNKSVSIGDHVQTLQTHFPNSFNEFISRVDSDPDMEKELYIRIAKVFPNAISYDGIINITVKENKIIRVSASFEPA